MSHVCGDPVSCNHAVGGIPTAPRGAFSVPMSVLNSNMKRQITAAATNEIAIGMNTPALAIGS